MILIAHRGNISGPNPIFENNPEYIDNALLLGYHVEIDVWYIDNEWFLGHDHPEYKVETGFLQNKNLWFHAKNLHSLENLIKNNITCFWHQTDDFTLTSNGLIWICPNQSIAS